MRWLTVFLLMSGVASLGAQCHVQSKVQPNGQVHRIAREELMYQTNTYTVYCAARHDGMRYFFELLVKPTFFRKVKKDQVELRLSNGTKSQLEFYDATELKKDSVMDILFEIDTKTLELLRNFDIHSVSFSTEKGAQRYKLVDHRKVLREQLNCLYQKKEKDK